MSLPKLLKPLKKIHQATCRTSQEGRLLEMSNVFNRLQVVQLRQLAVEYHLHYESMKLQLLLQQSEIFKFLFWLYLWPNVR
jgi:hypothetical protein